MFWRKEKRREHEALQLPFWYTPILLATQQGEDEDW
jgi:hypothetical protein